jgi:DNA processing protein
LTPLDAKYPSRLRRLLRPPATLSTQGGPLEADHVIAIVGSRECTREAATFATNLGAALARAGVVVLSGGALGIDAAAHQGALEAGGRTWAVAATGYGRCFPAVHADLFDAIARGPGAMIWPFSRDYSHRSAFPVRNHVLAALADDLVVVQAGDPSGALHAAGCARRIGRAVWAVPAAPWTEGYAGIHKLLDAGARPLTSIPSFLAAQGLSRNPPARPRTDSYETSPRADLLESPSEASLSSCHKDHAILQAISTAPLHLDAISARAGAPPQAVAAALLTLALENVVVEGPPGFFRRRHGR